jgi:hypothetical protein
MSVRSDQAKPEGAGKAKNVFDYTVDDEPQETSEHVLTAEQILRNAGLDPAQRYLIELRGKHQESYEGRPTAEIRMHEKMKFITAGTGPTPVS